LAACGREYDERDLYARVSWIGRLYGQPADLVLLEIQVLKRFALGKKEVLEMKARMKRGGIEHD